MLLAVFGTTIYPSRSEFATAVGNHLRLYGQEYAGVAFEEEHMIYDCAAWFAGSDLTYSSFAFLFPRLQPGDAAIAVLNITRDALFVLPSDVDSSGQHHTTLIEFAIAAMGLKRRVFTNNYEALGNLSARYLKDSIHAPSRRA